MGEGAPIAYSTGIAEVSLPIDVKLRNIEETQRALELKQRKGGPKGPEVDHSISTWSGRAVVEWRGAD